MILKKKKLSQKKKCEKEKKNFYCMMQKKKQWTRKIVACPMQPAPSAIKTRTANFFISVFLENHLAV